MILSEKKQAVSRAQDVAPIIKAILDAEDEISRGREHFYCIGVNTKNVIQYIELVSLGSLTAAVVHPRETFRFAVLKGVCSIIVSHNHPSGDSKPSQEDILLTRRLVSAGDVLGIKVLDHVILGEEGFFSFQENGMIQGQTAPN